MELKDKMCAHLLARTYTSKKTDKLYPEANWDKWDKSTKAWGYSVVDELMELYHDSNAQSD